MLHKLFTGMFIACFASLAWRSDADVKKDADAPPQTQEVPKDDFSYEDLNTENLRKFLDEKDFDKIERIAEDLRKNKSRYGPGWWMETGFHRTLKAGPSSDKVPDRKARVKLFEEWKAKHPESVTASISLAAAHESIGWTVRGSGFADTVTEEGWRVFNEEEEIAWKILKDAESLEQKDPELYRELLYVAMGLGKDRREVEKLLEEGLAIEPEYYPLYEQFAFYLTPRWFGRPGDIEKFASKTVDAGGPGRGAEIYVRIALENLRFVGDDEFMQLSKFSWEKLNNGFLAFEKLYPDYRSIMNQYARLAAMFKQKEIAKPLFEKIHDDFYVASAWPSEAYFKKYKEWAIGEGKYPETTELHLAAHARDLDQAKRLIKNGADVNATDAFGSTPLFRAVGEKDRDMIEMLLSSGADVNFVDGSGWTPLISAISSKDEEVIKILFKSGANPNLAYSDGRTPTYFAVAAGAPILKLILEKKPDVNKKTNNGWSPFMYAVHEKWADRVRLLCENGVDVNEEREGGYTGIWVAARDGDWDTVETLLDFHADACKPDKEGWLPLHLAVAGKNAKALRRMLRKGADANCKMEKSGWTALHLASNNGFTEVVQALLEFSNVDVNARSKTQDTPLHLAVWEGREDIVKLLVAKGADLTAKGTMGQTPIRYSKITHRKSIQDILEKAIKEKEGTQAAAGEPGGK